MTALIVEEEVKLIFTGFYSKTNGIINKGCPFHISLMSYIKLQAELQFLCESSRGCRFSKGCQHEHVA